MHFNVSAVLTAALAASQTDDEVAEDLADTPFADAFKAAQEEEREDSKKALVGTIKSCLASHRKMIDSERSAIRRHKSAISTSKKKMNHLDRAKAYALETGNLVPLLVALGGSYRVRCEAGDSWESISKIPADWKPKSEG